MIWNEMGSLKGQRAETGNDKEANPSADGSQEACPQDDLAMDNMDTGLDIEIDRAHSQPDPVEVKARELAFGDLSHITVEHDIPKIVQALRERMLPNMRVLYMVDAPTSRIRCLLELVQAVETISKEFATTQFSLLITCGHRLDLLASVHANLFTRWPDKPAYVIQVPTSSVQTHHNLPSYVVYMAQEIARGKTFPTTLSMTNVKASAYECLRLMCRDAKCPLRGSDMSGPVDETDIDDREPDAVQDLLEEARRWRWRAQQFGRHVPWVYRNKIVHIFSACQLLCVHAKRAYGWFSMEHIPTSDPDNTSRITRRRSFHGHGGDLWPVRSEAPFPGARQAAYGKHLDAAQMAGGTKLDGPDNGQASA